MGVLARGGQGVTRTETSPSPGIDCRALRSRLRKTCFSWPASPRARSSWLPRSLSIPTPCSAARAWTSWTALARGSRRSISVRLSSPERLRLSRPPTVALIRSTSLSSSVTSSCLGSPGVEPAQQVLDRRADRGQRVADLVRHPRRELAHGGQALGPVEAVEAIALSPVERGVLERQAGLRGEQIEQLDVAASEAPPRQVRAEEEDPGQAVERDHRHAEVEPQAVEQETLGRIEIFEHTGLAVESEAGLVHREPARQLAARRQPQLGERSLRHPQRKAGQKARRRPDRRPE